MTKKRALLWLIPTLILLLLIPFIVPSAIPYAGKVMKIFYKTNGIQSKKSELTSSGVSKSIDSDLQSIPSISEFTDNSMFSNNNIKNKYGKENIQNLKTIKEATVIEDSENSNSEMVKSKISSDILDYAVTKKIDSNYDTDSSNYTGKKSIKKDESTIRMDHFLM